MKLTILSPEGKVRPKCECCMEQVATMYDFDPYELEIYDNYIKIFMCEQCYKNACDEI